MKIILNVFDYLGFENHILNTYIYNLFKKAVKKGQKNVTNISHYSIKTPKIHKN